MDKLTLHPFEKIHRNYVHNIIILSFVGNAQEDESKQKTTTSTTYKNKLPARPTQVTTSKTTSNMQLLLDQ